MEYLVTFGRMGYIDRCEIFYMVRTATQIMTEVAYKIRMHSPKDRFDSTYHEEWYNKVYPLINNAYARIDNFMGKNFKNTEDYRTYTVKDRDYTVVINSIVAELYKLTVYRSSRQFYLGLLRILKMLDIIYERILAYRCICYIETRV